jgi:hypothetical protein
MKHPACLPHTLQPWARCWSSSRGPSTRRVRPGSGPLLHAPACTLHCRCPLAAGLLLALSPPPSINPGQFAAAAAAPACLRPPRNQPPAPAHLLPPPAPFPSPPPPPPLQPAACSCPTCPSRPTRWRPRWCTSSCWASSNAPIRGECCSVAVCDCVCCAGGWVVYVWGGGGRVVVCVGGVGGGARGGGGAWRGRRR